MQRRSIFESLEQRRLLAGNVTVTLTSGTLAINGDSRSNDITITASSTGYSITGANTAVTSSSPGAVPIAGGVSFPGIIPTAIRASLGNGDDTVTLAGTSDTTDFDIQTGNGNDDIVFDNSGFFTKGDMHIETGNGNDEVRVGLVEFFQDTVTIDLGKGIDTFAITGFLILNQSSATLDGGGGGSDTLRDGDESTLIASTLQELRFENHLT